MVAATPVLYDLQNAILYVPFPKRENRKGSVQRDMMISNGMKDLLSSFHNMYVTEDMMVPFLCPADQHAVHYEQLWSTLPSIEQPNLGWKQVHVLPDTGTNV